MGFFSWVSEKASAAKDWFCEKASAAKDYVCEKASTVKEKVSNVWGKFTGKNTYDEANRLYEEISARYKKKREQFQKAADDYANKIEKHIRVINQSKLKIKTELFYELADKMRKIKDINIDEDFVVEMFADPDFDFDTIRSKSELFTIDFDKNKFKTTLQAIFTFGILTRKKAKESLIRVQEEEKKVDNEMAKMDAEIKRLKVIEECLENVEHYFVTLIELYENLLLRLDGSVNHLYTKCLVFAHKLVDAQLKIRRLPVMRQKEVEAMITISKILKAMTEVQLVACDDKEKVAAYRDEMKKQHTAINDAYKAA